MEIGGRRSQWTYTMALRTSSRGMTPSFSPGKSSCAFANSWNTSLISFSWSPVKSFSLASLDWRVRLGTALAEELTGAPRFLGGCLRAMVSRWTSRSVGFCRGITISRAEMRRSLRWRSVRVLLTSIKRLRDLESDDAGCGGNAGC